MLGYSTAGSPRGHPLLYLHGAIGSPVRRSPELEAAIAQYDLRYVMVDRPGFGASDAKPGRRVADFAGDVEQLADALGLNRFSILGVSAGGPYALACAWAMPDRVAAAASVSSLPPGLSPARAAGMSAVLRLSLGALLAAPDRVAGLGDSVLETLRRHPGLLARALVAGAPRADRRLLAEPEARETAVRSFFAAAERGVRPMVDDYVVCSSPWGFAPPDIRGSVHLWHGERDRLVPIRHLSGLVAGLPNCVARAVAGEGHFFLRTHLPQIIAPLVGATGGAEAATTNESLGLAA